MGIELRIRWVVRGLGRREEDRFGIVLRHVLGRKGVILVSSSYHSHHHDHLLHSSAPFTTTTLRLQSFWEYVSVTSFRCCTSAQRCINGPH